MTLMKCSVAACRRGCALSGSSRATQHRSARCVLASAAGPDVQEHEPVTHERPVHLESEPDAITSSDRPADGSWFGLSAATKGMLLLNLGAMLFGSNQVVIKTSEELLSPAGLNALRFSAAAVCFLPLLPRALKQSGLTPASLELGVWLTLGYMSQAVGLSMTSASHGAFTLAFTAVTVPLLVGFSGKSVGMKTWAAAAVAVLGVGLLTTAGGDPNLGDLICVASACLFGVHKWRSESIVAGVSDSQSLVTLQLCFLALCSLALATPEIIDLVSSRGIVDSLVDAKSLPWVEILFMGVGTTALTLWIEMEALKDVSAQLAALIYTSEPLWGAAFAWVLLGDRWGAQGWVGASMIVGASVFSQLKGDNKQSVGAAQLKEAERDEKPRVVVRSDSLSSGEFDLKRFRALSTVGAKGKSD